MVDEIAEGDDLYVGNDWDELLGITISGLPATYPDELVGLERVCAQEEEVGTEILRPMWQPADRIPEEEYMS